MTGLLVHTICSLKKALKCKIIGLDVLENFIQNFHREITKKK